MRQEEDTPQNGERLRELRQSTGKNQAEMATELEKILKPHMWVGYTIQQADVSRLELERSAIDLPKLLGYASYFKLDIANLLKPKFQPFCKSDTHLQIFEDTEQANQYLTQLEKGGRILVYTQFPSDFFCTEPQGQRLLQIAKADYPATEIYSLDAFLSFLFSPVSAYSLDEKTEILTRYLGYFRNNLRHNLRFFTRSTLSGLSHVPNMEILPEGKALLLPSPVLQHRQGDAFFELRSAELFEKAYGFYQQLHTLDGNLVFLRIGLETLDRMRDGSPARDAIRFFYQEVCKRTFDCASAVLENFSPEIQEMIKA